MRRHFLPKNIRTLSGLPKKSALSKSDYYQILGVSPNATLTEVREAYFRKVKMYHPDINPSSEAKILFEQVQEAYKGNTYQGLTLRGKCLARARPNVEFIL